MKYILCIIVFAFVIAETVLIVEFKRYIKKHEDEQVNDNLSAFLTRIIPLTIIPLIVGIIGIVIQFI